MRTQHDMKCVGIGLPEGSPLRYVANLSIPEMIGTFKASLYATSEDHARTVIESCEWFANEAPKRTLTVTVESLQLL